MENLIILWLSYFISGMFLQYIMWNAYVTKVENEYEAESSPWELGRTADLTIGSIVLIMGTLVLVAITGILQFLGNSIDLPAKTLLPLGFAGGGIFSFTAWKIPANGALILWKIRVAPTWQIFWGNLCLFVVVLYVASTFQYLDFEQF